MRAFIVGLRGAARLLALTLACFAAAGVDPRARAADDQKRPRVLVLHSYHPGFATRETAVAEIRAALSDRTSLYEEFLDTKRFEPERSFLHMALLLEEKLARSGPPALVITLDDHALIFADQFRQALFPEAALVFTGVNDRARAVAMAAKPGVTGVLEGFSIDRTLDLAYRLNPVPLRRVVALTNASASSLATFEILRREAEARGGLAIEALALDETTFAAAAARLAADTRADTAYLFLAAFQDASGATLDGAAVIRRLSARSQRPIYLPVDYGPGSGGVGGHLVSGREQARAATAIAERVLAGEPIDRIPPVLRSPNRGWIDISVAERYGLRTDRLGSDVERANEPKTFMERHGAPLASAVGVLALMLALLSAVQLVNRRVRDRLRALNATLEERNEALLLVQGRIEHQARHDALTGLPNRRYLEQRFRETIDGAHRAEPGWRWALLQIDLDRFKLINDMLGHAAGDHVLTVVADVLRRHLPPQGFAARIGGDEFVVLAPFQNVSAVEALANTLISDLGRPVPFEGHLCRFGASIGVAVAPEDLETAIDMIRNADVALYRAKGEGRGCFAFFSEEQQAEMVATKKLADDLVRGIEAGEFLPYFQPQICARSGRVYGMEALVRWRHPERGVLAPFHFMHAAEGVGRVHDLDRIVLSAARRHLEAWRGQGFDLDQISVNVSTKRLLDPALPDVVRHLEFGRTALCFELLESIFLDHEDDPAMHAVDRLRETGVRIEIDDFGSGHASIISLLRIRPDKFKIARELVAAIETEPERLSLVRAIIDMGKSLGMGVVAEGVETEAQRRLLSGLGVDVLQGYAISRPIPPEEVPVFLRQLARPAMRAG